MKINYVAYDGKIFDNKRECLEYENNQKTMKENLICLDEDLCLIDYGTLDFDNEVYFILAKNDLACKALQKRFSESWIDIPKGGFQPNIVYWWNDDRLVWVNVQKELEELQEKIEFFEDILAIEYFNN